MNEHVALTYVDRLKAENQRLSDRVKELEAIIWPKYLFPVEWRLTAAQRNVLSILIGAAAYVTIERLYTVAFPYGGVLKKNIEPDKKSVIQVQVFRIRTQTEIKIKTLRSVGYSIEPEEKARVLAIIKPECLAQSKNLTSSPS